MKEQSLKGEIAVVTGSDSGIGQATAIAFAREGADVAITYLEDQEGADHTRKLVEEAGRKAVVMPLDQTHGTTLVVDGGLMQFMGQGA